MVEGSLMDDANECGDRDAALADAISDDEMEAHLMDVLEHPDLWMTGEEMEEVA
jgi:hypothetical protein